MTTQECGNNCEPFSIAVLMTVHNRCSLTIKCVKNILSQKVNNIKLYIVDDGSTDGTHEALNNYSSEITVIQGNGNLFWNRGMHLAWKTATKDSPDYYLWLNDDTTLMANSISRLLSCSKLLQDKSIIVGSTYASKKNKVLSYGGRMKVHNNPFVAPDNNVPVECDTFNGNIVLIPRSVFEKVGYNDNFYHHSFGDFDYGIVAGLNGIKSYVAPGFYGYCERNNPIPCFRRKCYTVIKRYKLLYSPWGHNPIEDYHLNRKFLPLWLCMWYFIKLHINVLFAIDHTKYENV